LIELDPRLETELPEKIQLIRKFVEKIGLEDVKLS